MGRWSRIEPSSALCFTVLRSLKAAMAAAPPIRPKARACCSGWAALQAR
jgi:hypothetical protein